MRNNHSRMFYLHFQGLKLWFDLRFGLGLVLAKIVEFGLDLGPN